jgi:transglutaminase-like putative cysteine protease
LDLVRFVDKTIEHKHSGRGYDIASVVARRREGDCTEHAVLLAAVLRLAGFPSHLVTGIALFTDKGQPMAFGHAWVEYHDGQAWQLADASNPPSIVRRMRYVPLELRPEGPNAGRMSFEGFRMVYVEGIVVPPGFSAELPDEPGLSG